MDSGRFDLMRLSSYEMQGMTNHFRSELDSYLAFGGKGAFTL